MEAVGLADLGPLLVALLLVFLVMAVIPVELGKQSAVPLSPRTSGPYQVAKLPDLMSIRPSAYAFVRRAAVSLLVDEMHLGVVQVRSLHLLLQLMEGVLELAQEPMMALVLPRRRHACGAQGFKATNGEFRDTDGVSASAPKGDGIGSGPLLKESRGGPVGTGSGTHE